MLQQQPVIKLDEAIAPSKKLQQLVAQSIATLETLLCSETISVHDRVTVALKILEAASATPIAPDGQQPPANLAQPLTAPSNPTQPEVPASATPIEGLHQVTLLLAGGHQYVIQLQREAPLLHELLQIVVARSQNPTAFHGVFQIPVNQGRSALCFPCEHLVGVITEPPVVLQLAPEASQSAPFIPQTPQTQPVQPPPSNLQPLQFAAPPSVFVPANYLMLEQFLSPAENHEALHIALTKASEFLASTTTTNETGYRRSSLLYATLFPEFYSLLRSRILQVLPSVLQQLCVPAFAVGQVEMQLVAHNDGCYYKVHNDSGSEGTATREISYVYYFHQEPKAFSGGELKIYDTELTGRAVSSRDRTQIVVPQNNSIVFFDSRLQHEVMPVSCPSQAFEHSRFALNGWLRHADIPSTVKTPTFKED